MNHDYRPTFALITETQPELSPSLPLPLIRFLLFTGPDSLLFVPYSMSNTWFKFKPHAIMIDFLHDLAEKAHSEMQRERER